MGIPILGPACTAGPPRRRTEAGGANLAPVCQEQWAALLRRHSLQDIETVTKFPLAEAEVGQLATSDSSFGLLDAVVQKIGQLSHPLSGPRSHNTADWIFETHWSSSGRPQQQARG